MIRNVMIHVTNEQPLLADLYTVPTADDAGLLCTNVRMMDGKRPVFIDRIDATFFFPYHVIRFLEIPVGAMEGHVPAEMPLAGIAADASSDRAGKRKGRPDDAAAASVPDERLPVLVATGEELPEGEIELEIDEDFLRRVRDI
jgi:hypothetical protein